MTQTNTLPPSSAELTKAASDPYAAFRQELVAFTESPALAPLKKIVRTNQKLSRAEFSAWQKALFAKGWGAPNWPVEYGGTGWDLQQRYLFEEVTAAADCPPVRTSSEGRKQAGISLLLVPLNTPGIEIRAIHTVDQWHHVNEVFLNDVRVPAKYLVGEEGEGWKCAKFLLDRERLSPATVPRLARQLEQVSELLAQKMKTNPGLPSIHSLQERLFIAQASAKGSRQMLLSAIQEEMHGTLASSKSSALKLHTSELSQQIVGIAFDIAGPEYAARLVPEIEAADGADDMDIERQLTHTYLFYRSRSIAGGTSEVQKNVIARDLFGA